MVRFDVEEFIDRQKIGMSHVVALAVCTLFMFIDGFDVFIVGKIAPAIAKSFGEPPAAMTFLFLMQQIGLAIGAFVVSPLADRYGRRKMLVISATLFGIITLLSVFSMTLLQLSIMRGISGLFMSAGLPMALALISENTPRRRRSTFVVIAMAGFTAGGAASGAVAAWLLDDYGWQSGMWIGGIVPLVCVPLMLAFVPESLKFRAGRNGLDPSIARSVMRAEPGIVLTGNEIFTLGATDAPPAKAKLVDVFTEGRGFTTSVLWACCLLSMGNIALLGAWMPTFFQEMAGVSIQRFAVLAMIAFSGGFAGTLTIGYLMDRIRPTTLISIYYLGLAASLTALGSVSFEAPVFLFLLIAWSFFQSGGQAGINSLITQVYPPRMRSTALGWAGGAGRIGGVIAPLFGGLAVAQHFSLQFTLGLIAIPAVLVALLIMLLHRHRDVRSADHVVGVPAQ